MGKPIGIDLGTTYSAIARWNDAGLVVGPECYRFQQEGKNFIASKIYIPDLKNLDNTMYGSHAIKFATIDPERFYSAFKRGMDDNKEICRPSGKITPVELSTMLLKHMIKDAVLPVEGVDFVPEGVSVSVPYYFKEPSSQNTRTALDQALDRIYSKNLDYESNLDLGTLPEPVAAGLDYAFSNLDNLKPQNILIFDLGGGTFDVTIYELKNSSKKLEFTILATDGDDRLGGEDFDAAILKYILQQQGISEEMAKDTKYKNSLARLKLEVTETKCLLSSVPTTTLHSDYFFDQAYIDMSLSSNQIEKILTGENGGVNYIAKIDDIVDRCILKSGIQKALIDRVVLVGGSSRIPCIRKSIEGKFGANKIFQSPVPEETVARGACIWATYKIDHDNKDNPDYRRHLHYWDEIIIKEKTAHNLGVKDAHNKIDTIIASNRFTPVRATRSYLPNRLNEDGTKAELAPLVIHQGKDEIGKIPIPVIYAHGRQRTDINILVTMIAESTSVKVLIDVPKGNEDGSDLHTEGQIQIA
jgi:molecular chaperone DnaK (HSP70)